MVLDEEKFYKEFKELYQGVEIIGKELFKIKDQMEKLSSELTTIRNDLSTIKNSRVQMPSSSSGSSSMQHNTASAPARPADPTRVRTGNFNPGDSSVDVSNVFYTGNKKR